MIEVGKPRIGNRISSFSLSFSSFVFCTNLQVEAKQHSVEFLLRHRLIAKYGRLYKIENNSGRRGIARGIVWTIAWRHYLDALHCKRHFLELFVVRDLPVQALCGLCYLVKPLAHLPIIGDNVDDCDDYDDDDDDTGTHFLPHHEY